MAKVRIDQLPNCPPDPGGAFNRGDILRAGADEVVITSFGRVDGKHLFFGGKFAGKERGFDYVAENETIAQQVGDAIACNAGRTLRDIGLIEPVS